DGNAGRTGRVRRHPAFWEKRACGSSAAVAVAAATATAVAAAATTAVAATTAATVAAAASAAAATTATESAAAAALVARLVDDEIAALQRVAIHGADGCLCRAVIGHGDEAETPRTAGFSIGDDLGLGNIAVRSEELGELRIGGSPGQVADVDLGWHEIGVHRIVGCIAFRGEPISANREMQPHTRPVLRGSFRKRGPCGNVTLPQA